MPNRGGIGFNVGEGGGLENSSKLIKPGGWNKRGDWKILEYLIVVWVWRELYLIH